MPCCRGFSPRCSASTGHCSIHLQLIQGFVLSDKQHTVQQIWRRIEGTAKRLNTRWSGPLRHLFRWGIPVVLLAFLAYALTQVGWAKIFNARPSSLWFYFVLLLPFFVQPIADWIIYRNLLGVGRTLPLTVFLRKRYMNTIMLDYSGEVYFFFWARKNLKLRDGLLLHAVKDCNVLSASAGLVVLWLMLLALVMGGIVKIPMLHTGTWSLILLGSLPLVLGLALLAGGRKVTALRRIDIVVTFAIHLARCIVTLWLEYMIWWLSGALPTAGDCLKFVALRLLVTRLPLVPNKDLVFVGVGIAAAGIMNVSAPKAAAVLVLMTAVGLIQDFVVVGLPWLLEQLPSRRKADQPVL